MTSLNQNESVTSLSQNEVNKMLLTQRTGPVFSIFEKKNLHLRKWEFDFRYFGRHTELLLPGTVLRTHSDPVLKRCDCNEVSIFICREDCQIGIQYCLGPLNFTAISSSNITRRKEKQTRYFSTLRTSINSQYCILYTFQNCDLQVYTEKVLHKK